jgi:hypothetical protein
MSLVAIHTMVMVRSHSSTTDNVRPWDVRISRPAVNTHGSCRLANDFQKAFDRELPHPIAGPCFPASLNDRRNLRSGFDDVVDALVVGTAHSSIASSRICSVARLESTLRDDIDWTVEKLLEFSVQA